MEMDFVHIWLADFPSEEAFSDYIDEHYGEDDLPINQFAVDQNENFYDHDWFKSSFKVVDKVEALIQSHSYSQNYFDDVVQKAKQLVIKTANTFIMIDSNEVTSPQSKQAENYSL